MVGHCLLCSGVCASVLYKEVAAIPFEFLFYGQIDMVCKLINRNLKIRNYFNYLKKNTIFLSDLDLVNIVAGKSV